MMFCGWRRVKCSILAPVGPLLHGVASTQFSDVLVCKSRCVWYDTDMRHSLTDGVGASNLPTLVDVLAGRPAAYTLYIPVARH